MTHLLLFDVDSVLVDPQGYLVALQDTVAHFSTQMGVGPHPPAEDEVRTFEAHGLSSEWDSGAACVAALLLDRLQREPELRLPPDWPGILAALSARPCPLPHPDYATLARESGQRIKQGLTAAQAARSYLAASACTIRGLDRDDGRIDGLLDLVLGHTHDFYRAPITRHFQQLAIGSAAVGRTYGVVPDFECPPYLLRHDRPLLGPESRVRLSRSVAGGHVRAALYTARPSLPPAEAGGATVGYSPEAEMARELVGLEAYPIIGLGKIEWLAAEVGGDTASMVKPSPVQALAAMGAALAGGEREALVAAFALVEHNELRPPLADLAHETVHVFEDTVGGIAAVARGVALLRAAGLDVEWRAWGIAPPGGPKWLAMQENGYPTTPTIDEAITATLSAVS